MNDSYSIDIALDYLTLDYLKFHHMKLCIVIALLHMLYPLMKCQRTSVRKLFCVLKKHGFSKSLQFNLRYFKQFPNTFTIYSTCIR